MQMEHNFTVPAPVDTVWEALLDLDRVVPCLPGATMTWRVGGEFAGTVKVRLGSISLQYKGIGKFTETDASARRAVIEASGREAQGNGTASAMITAVLEEEGAGTAVTVVTDLNVTGKAAQFGRGLVSQVGGKIIGQFADCLAGTLAGSADAPATPAESEEPPVSSEQDTAGQPAGAAARPARPVPDEIDLLDTAGGSVLKRAAPVAGGLLLLLLLMRWLRRR